MTVSASRAVAATAIVACVDLLTAAISLRKNTLPPDANGSTNREHETGNANREREKERERKGERIGEK
jgi:hypothetical protein